MEEASVVPSHRASQTEEKLRKYQQQHGIIERSARGRNNALFYEKNCKSSKLDMDIDDQRGGSSLTEASHQKVQPYLLSGEEKMPACTLGKDPGQIQVGPLPPMKHPGSATPRSAHLLEEIHSQGGRPLGIVRSKTASHANAKGRPKGTGKARNPTRTLQARRLVWASRKRKNPPPSSSFTRDATHTRRE